AAGDRRLLAQLRGGVLDRLHDVHVARAPAQVAGDRVPDLVFRRVRVPLEQRDGGHHHAGRTVAALEPVLLVEALLHGVQRAVPLESLDRRDLPAVRLHGEHRAGFHRPAVQQHGARAAVRGVAADVRAGQPERLADQVHQQRAGLDLRHTLGAVHRHPDLVVRHGQRPPAVAYTRSPGTAARPSARSRARRSARIVNTRTRSRLYSAEPRRSAVGCASSAASRPASRIVASSSGLPARNASVRTALIGMGPTLVRPTPARVHVPSSASVPCAATAAVAKSPTFRSSLKYAPPLRGAGAGTRISFRISSGSSAVVNTPVKNSVTGITRSPDALRTTTSASSASIVAGWSFAGSPCARLPHTVARLRTSGSAITRAVSARMG